MGSPWLALEAADAGLVVLFTAAEPDVGASRKLEGDRAGEIGSWLYVCPPGKYEGGCKWLPVVDDDEV